MSLRDPHQLLMQEIRQDDLPGPAAVEARGFPPGTVLLLVPVDENGTSYELAFTKTDSFYVRQVVEPGRYNVSIKDGSDLGIIVVNPTAYDVARKLGLDDIERHVLFTDIGDALEIDKLNERLDELKSRLDAIESGKLPAEAITNIAEEVEVVLVAAPDRVESE